MIAVLLSVMAPISIVAAIGYGWVRCGQAFDNRFVGSLVTYVGTPCLVLRSFNQQTIDLAAFASMSLATILMTTVMGLTGLAILWRMRLSVADYLPALMFPNVANMGLPVVLFTFGAEGLALAIVVMVVQIAMHNTVGIAIHAGSAKLSVLARLPVIYAVIVGLMMIMWGLHLPEWAARAVELLGNLTIPLMLLALGAALARLPIHHLRTSAVISGLRIGGGLAVALLVAWGLGLGPVERGVLLLQGSMPVAVVSYLYTERFGRSGEEIAGTVVVSTIASLVTVPLLVWLLLPA